ncbi:MAG: hypothetical protein QM534_13010 [Sediminibacterium sp.]|nr:hypothetical protein [Sediminibacterium sp.]
MTQNYFEKLVVFENIRCSGIRIVGDKTFVKINAGSKFNVWVFLTGFFVFSIFLSIYGAWSFMLVVLIVTGGSILYNYKRYDFNKEIFLDGKKRRVTIKEFSFRKLKMETIYEFDFYKFEKIVLNKVTMTRNGSFTPYSGNGSDCYLVEVFLKTNSFKYRLFTLNAGKCCPVHYEEFSEVLTKILK